MNKLSKFRLCGEVQGTVTEKLLSFVLHEICNESGEITIPQRKISGALGLSKSTVSRNLRRLHETGYIKIYPQYHSDGGRAANKYQIR